jgi:hypothetical protein
VATTQTQATFELAADLGNAYVWVPNKTVAITASFTRDGGEEVSQTRTLFRSIENSQKYEFNIASDVSDGATINVGAAGKLTEIVENGNYTLTGTDATGKQIIVGADVTATLTLDSVVMQGAQSPLIVQGGADLTLILPDGTVSSFTANGAAGLGNPLAGIYVQQDAKLTITTPGDAPLHNGRLTAQASTVANAGSAGIGGIHSSTDAATAAASGQVVIASGVVVAMGGPNGAGIGGGNFGTGNVLIHGGTVTAQGGASAAGIGGGNTGTAGTITIDGEATVTATGGAAGAGIGSGNAANSGTINISAGMVTATGGTNAAGIGTGTLNAATNSTVTNISGGTIVAKGTGT